MAHHQISCHLRLSPYLANNLIKYKPSALIPQDSHLNHLQIKNHQNHLQSFLSYDNLHNQPIVPIYEEKKCYFCARISTQEDQYKNCRQCRKVICGLCQKRCKKCMNMFCQLDITYDYKNQCQSCFSC